VRIAPGLIDERPLEDEDLLAAGMAVTRVVRA
jgi:hypothetical protein